MSLLEKAILEGRDLRSDETLSKHADWARELCKKYTFTEDNVTEIIRKEIGIVFAKVLEHAGVFKRDEQGRKAFERFAAAVNKEE